MEELDQMTSGAGRVCGYSQCGAALDYDGRGRPPEYCADRRWPPDNKTCKQMAATERAGERAAGLDAPLADFRATADRFAPVAAELAAQLGEVVDAVHGVADGALVRVRDAEQVATAAVDRAQAADEVAARAVRAQRAAETEAAQAKDTAREAEARARTARRDADEQVQRATQRAAEAERARGRAEATAAAATAALAEATDRRDDAERRAAAADQRATSLTAEVAVLRRDLDAAAADATHLRRDVADLAADRDKALARADTLDARLREVTEQREATRAAAEIAEAGRQRALADLEALQARVDRTYGEQIGAADGALEKITVEVGDPPLTKGFVGRWLVGPDPDATRTGLEGHDAGAYWGIALTRRGRVAVYVAHCNGRWPAQLTDFDDLDQAGREVPADIIARAAAELGEQRVLWRDI